MIIINPQISAAEAVFQVNKKKRQGEQISFCQTFRSGQNATKMTGGRITNVA